MLRLITENYFIVKGKGTAYTINLKENNLSPMRYEFNKLKGQDVLLNDSEQVFKIIGLEAFAIGPEIEHEKIGILVKPKDKDVKFGQLLNLHSADKKKI